MNKPDISVSTPRWGSHNRDIKARAILATLGHFVSPASMQQSVCVDIGCGSGEIAFHLAPYMQSITGIDPEPWPQWKNFGEERSNLRFLCQTAEALPVPADSVDVVVCNQVYEHVPDPVQLISEIHRILKPGGYCYFAGPNLLFPVEPHIFWPFVHWLPRDFAVSLLRFCGSKAVLDATSTHYWKLTHWLAGFEVENCVPRILKHPQSYGRRHPAWRVPAMLPYRLLDLLTWISPAFVFVLRKPPEAGAKRTGALQP